MDDKNIDIPQYSGNYNKGIKFNEKIYYVFDGDLENFYWLHDMSIDPLRKIKDYKQGYVDWFYLSKSENGLIEYQSRRNPYLKSKIIYKTLDKNIKNYEIHDEISKVDKIFITLKSNILGNIYKYTDQRIIDITNDNIKKKRLNNMNMMYNNDNFHIIYEILNTIDRINLYLENWKNTNHYTLADIKNKVYQMDDQAKLIFKLNRFKSVYVIYDDYLANSLILSKNNRYYKFDSRVLLQSFDNKWHIMFMNHQTYNIDSGNDFFDHIKVINRIIDETELRSKNEVFWF